MISSHDIIDIVDSSRSEPNFEEISGPGTSVSIFGLILREVGSIDMVVNISVSFIPLLIVILFEMVMSRVNCEIFPNPSG